jgi:hypothetical protein
MQDDKPPAPRKRATKAKAVPKQSAGKAASKKATATPPAVPKPGKAAPPSPTAATQPPAKAAKKATAEPAATTAPEPPAKATATPGATTGPRPPAKAAKKATATPSPTAATQPPAKAAKKAAAAPAAKAAPEAPGNAIDEAAAPAKATPRPRPSPRKTARKAAPGPADTPVTLAVPEPPAATSVPATRPAQVVEPIWPAIKTRPGDAPELLALAAVHRFGGEARADASWLRETYPTATADGLARLSAQRFVRQARIQGAVAGLVGPLALLAESVGLVVTHARLVLHMAAAYGVDPADAARAADLLVLQGFHPDLRSAEAALERARRPSDEMVPARQLAGTIARAAGRSLVKVVVARRASRLVPGAGALVAALLDGRDAERLAIRAARHYRRLAQ